MSLDEQVMAATFVPIDGVWLMAKIGIIILAIFYFFFSLIVVRQISLMSQTLITEITPLLRAFSIIHAGAALGVVILMIQMLFN